jgi:hypothetical protein
LLADEPDVSRHFAIENRRVDFWPFGQHDRTTRR